MATLKKARSAQYVLETEFRWTVADSMVNSVGVLQALKASGAFDVCGLPPGAVLLAGELVVEVIGNDSGASTIAVGDSANPTRYLGATTAEAAARVPLVPTGYNGQGEDLRVTLVSPGGDATAGTFVVRAQYAVRGRANEVQPT